MRKSKQKHALLTELPATIQEVRLIVLVHGLFGKPNELDYLKSTLERQAKHMLEEQGMEEHVGVIVHSAMCNAGATRDGIEAGGFRLAHELNHLVSHYAGSKNQKEKRRVTLSLIGNSLGGLYTRYAVSYLQPSDNNDCCDEHSFRFVFGNDNNDASFVDEPGMPKTGFTTNPDFYLGVFVSTCTPHLGISRSHSYIALPRCLESAMGWILGSTGRDLLRLDLATNSTTCLLDQMANESHFLKPLASFQRRVAYANVYGTDFQVPFSTAAFVEDVADDGPKGSPRDPQLRSHQVTFDESSMATNTKKRKGNIVMELETTTRDQDLDTDAPNQGNSRHLNDLGWKKVLVNMRPHLPTLFRWPFSSRRRKEMKHETEMITFLGAAPTKHESETKPVQTQTVISARELLDRFQRAPRNSGYVIPMGHRFLVANSKNRFSRRLTKPGKPTMDYLARDVLEELLLQKCRL